MELTQETPAPTITKQRLQATHSLVLRASSHLVKRYYFALADNEVVEWNREGLSPQGRLRRRCREGAAGMGGRGGEAWHRSSQRWPVSQGCLISVV